MSSRNIVAPTMPSLHFDVIRAAAPEGACALDRIVANAKVEVFPLSVTQQADEF